MNSARDIIAEEIMDEEPLTASSDMRLSQVKNRMEEEEVRAIPVVSGDSQLEGVIGYRDLIRFIQFNPSKTKLSKVMHQPPEFSRDDNLVDLCDLRINSGRKMLVLTEGGKLKGVIGDQEFLRAFRETEELEEVSSREVATEHVLTVFEEDSLDEARHRMLDNNVSRLPVQDKNGNLTGILKSTDLLRAMVPREAQSSGGTSGGREGGDVYIAGGNEKQSMSKVTVDQLMERMVTTAEEDLDGNELTELMLEQGTTDVVFVDGKYPEAIVTVKDLINYIEGLKPSDMILVNLIGLEVPEEKSALHKQIRNQLRGSLGRKLDRPEELTVHVKKKDKDGKKHRYELNVKLASEYGVTNVEQEGWELLDVMDEALDKLNTRIRKMKEQRKEER